MSNLILIPENLLATYGATATAGSEASASMGAANLLTEAPSEFWRSESNAPSKTYFYFTSPGSAYGVDAMAFISHNLTRGDQYRIHTTSTSPVAGYTAYNPTGTVAGTTTNTTSTFADVDNGETTSPGTWATPTNSNLVWTLGLSFATPSVTPVTGADKQAFWVFVRGGITGYNNNYIDCALYESGVLVAALGRRYITSSVGQWLCFPWNASSLGTASGANVEVVLSMSKISVAYYVEVGSVIWAEDHTSRSNDTGWQTYTPYEGAGITYRPESAGSGGAILYRFSPQLSSTTIIVQIRSSRSPLDYVQAQEKLPTFHGYVQIGCVVMGQTWSPGADRDFGPLVATKDYSSKARTYGGQRFGSRRFVQRILSIPLNWLTPAEAHTLFDRILWRHGILKPILVSILPGDAVEEQHTTFLASLRNPENAMVATTTRVKSRAMTLEFEEEL